MTILENLKVFYHLNYYMIIILIRTAKTLKTYACNESLIKISNPNFKTGLLKHLFKLIIVIQVIIFILLPKTLQYTFGCFLISSLFFIILFFTFYTIFKFLNFHYIIFIISRFGKISWCVCCWQIF